MSLDALCLDPPQRLNADHVVGHMKIDILTKPDFERICVLVRISADRD
jgi:hypothetical protein